MMKKILWLSPFTPYDSIKHAGGKTLNAYVKFFAQSDEFKIRLLSICHCKEKEETRIYSSNLLYQLIIIDNNILQTVYRKIFNLTTYLNCYFFCFGILQSYQKKRLRDEIKKYKCNDASPDIVILHWTAMLLLLPYIKENFPNAYIISIEEDVTFLAFERKYKAENKRIKRWVKGRQYIRLLKKEVELLLKTDLIIVNNEKDAILLQEQGIERKQIFIGVPYFENYSKIKRNVKCDEYNIIFWGAMNRIENHMSVMWFIKNVMPFLKKFNVNFIVAGNEPFKELKNIRDKHIKVIGFVEDISAYFTKCLAMVAPLQLGAGVKVKVLEGLSSGITVLTNKIGIEGIPAIAGRDYIHCETAMEYAVAIENLINGKINGNEIGLCGRAFVNQNYDLNNMLNKLVREVKCILDK